MKLWKIVLYVAVLAVGVTSCIVQKPQPKIQITHVLAVTNEGDTLRLPIDAIRPNVYYNVIRYPSNRIWYNPYPYNYNWNYHTPIYVKPSGPRGSNTTTSGSGTNNTSPNLVRPPSKPSTPVNSGQNKINRN